MKITAFGADSYRRTQTYQSQVEKVRAEVHLRYAGLQSRASWFSKFIVKMKINMEVRKKISEIDAKNCY
jgi:hypothetical protein